MDATKRKAVPLAFLFIFSLFLFSFSQPSYAQEDSDSVVGKHAAGIGLGQVLLFGRHGEIYSNNFALNLIYDYGASELFGVMMLFHYSNHPGQVRAESDFYTIMAVNPAFRINFAYLDKLTVYANLGFAFFMLSEKFLLPEGKLTTFGYNAGPGIDLRLSNHFKVGANINFYHAFEKKDPESFLDMGGTFLKMTLNFAYIF